MRDVSRYSLLTREEELELAREYRDTGDPEAALRLVTANLRLVAKIAFQSKRYYHNVLDLIQEGNIGLMQAVKKFDPERGVRLSTYARYWIQAYILYFLLANHRLVKIGTTQDQRKVFFNLAKATQALRAEGVEPTPDAIADRLGVSEQVVIEMTQRLGASETSADAPLLGDDKEGPTLGATLKADSESPEDEVANADFRDRILSLLDAFGATLTDERELEVWNRRMRSEEPDTLQEIGQDFGVTRERARQIEAKIRKRLRAFLEQEMPDIEGLTMELLR
jgi:RNA polymerase sigma-32 factor